MGEPIESVPAPKVIVIGGTGVVGRAVVALLRERGAEVAFTYCTQNQQARALAEQREARAARLDLLETGAIEPTLRALCEGLGGLDALIFAAGLSSAVAPGQEPRYDAMEEVTEAGWDRLMGVSLKGAFFASRAVAVPLAGGDSPGGNLVFVGSMGGEKSTPSPAPFAASKAALGGLARCLAKELGPRNIRVNVVAPGLLEEGTSEQVPEHHRAEYLKHSCLKRLGTPEEAAQVIVTFALDNAYVTGRTIHVDGGV
jgi:3-oxoacyl-[acyl-carrier protein] reductase